MQVFCVKCLQTIIIYSSQEPKKKTIFTKVFARTFNEVFCTCSNNTFHLTFHLVSLCHMLNYKIYMYM